MSWLPEKWKNQIPHEALSHITSMESSIEKLNKEVSQYRFKTESLESELENVRQKHDEKLVEIQRIERENNSTLVQLEEAKENFKVMNQSLSLKDNHIVDLNEEVNRLKSDVKQHQNTIERLQFENSQLVQKQNDTGDQTKEDVSRLKEVCHLSTQRVEELKSQLDDKMKEKVEMEKTYEIKMQEVLDEMKNEKSTIATLNKQLTAMEFTIQKLENEKHAMKFNVKNAPSESEVQSLRDIVRQKDKEIGDMKNKFKSLGGDIGNYLGINVRKICSETSIRTDDYSKLLLKSKALQEELDLLKHKLAKRNEDEERYARDDLSRDVDSGVLSKPSSRDGAMKQNKAHTPSTSVNHEVIISRLEAGQLESESCSTMSQGKPLKTVEPEPLNACKEENVKLKQRITQMKEVYENHIKVCTNWSARKSLSSSSEQHESACAEEMRRKVIILEKTINELENNLKYKERYCSELHQELVRMKNTEISSNALSKLEELVDVIMQHKQQSTSNINTNCTPSSSSFAFDTEVLKSVVSHSLHSLQDGLVYENETVRQTIKNSTKEILSAVQSIHTPNSRKSSPLFKKDSRPVNVSGTRRSPCIVRSKAGIESIEEIEGIKDRIDNLQQLVFGRENEIRKIENERDRLSDELIRMVDVMKKKDEECGRLSRMYDIEKQKVDDNDACFHAEMDALKQEQLEIYKEFRDMCDNLKRKDIELMNKTKQTKMLNAEWREKEDSLNEKILAHEKAKYQLNTKLESLQKELAENEEENNLLLHRMNHAEEQLRTVFDNMTKVEDLMLQAKTDGLYT